MTWLLLFHVVSLYPEMMCCNYLLCLISDWAFMGSSGKTCKTSKLKLQLQCHIKRTFWSGSPWCIKAFSSCCRCCQVQPCLMRRLKRQSLF